MLENLLRTLPVIALVLPLAGCLEALKNHTREVRAAERHEAIEAECASRDAAALKERLGKESNKANHQRAEGCYTEIKLETLLASDCETFGKAFVWTEEKTRKGKRRGRNEMLDFSLDGFEEDER